MMKDLYIEVFTEVEGVTTTIACYYAYEGPQVNDLFVNEATKKTYKVIRRSWRKMYGKNEPALDVFVELVP